MSNKWQDCVLELSGEALPGLLYEWAFQRGNGLSWCLLG
jgi:hypothetical protein